MMTLHLHWCPECPLIHSSVAAVNPSETSLNLPNAVILAPTGLPDFGEMASLSADYSNDNAPDGPFNTDYDQDSIGSDCKGGTIDADKDLHF
jgi:hypothetical protein